MPLFGPHLVYCTAKTISDWFWYFSLPILSSLATSWLLLHPPQRCAFLLGLYLIREHMIASSFKMPFIAFITVVRRKEGKVIFSPAVFTSEVSQNALVGFYVIFSDLFAFISRANWTDVLEPDMESLCWCKHRSQVLCSWVGDTVFHGWHKKEKMVYSTIASSDWSRTWPAAMGARTCGDNRPNVKTSNPLRPQAEPATKGNLRVILWYSLMWRCSIPVHIFVVFVTLF